MYHYVEKVTASIEEAKEKLEHFITEDSLVFPIFTDLHTEDIDHMHMKKLIPVLELITDHIDYDATINLGDNFGMLGRNLHITNDDLKARFERVFGAVYAATKHPVINVNGNHDAPGTDFFNPDFWNSIVRGRYGNTMAVYDDSGCYYYIDYEKANTRLVILSLPHDSDVESEMPTPIWGFGKKQLMWMKETALNTDKDVIILSHVPFFYKYTGDMESTREVWTGSEARVSYASALCGLIEDIDEAVEIIKEYDNRPDTKLVACLSGHTHEDSFWLPGEEKDGYRNPLPCHQVVTTATCLTQNEESEIGIKLDIAVWNPSKRELNMIRIGDGEDRKLIC
ncbi:MAG: hypothetical protein E7397_07875 [Ruminococcaceae bacterium]|nr:hypothetical protein [Oscillospiraceae bacterium]